MASSHVSKKSTRSCPTNEDRDTKTSRTQADEDLSISDFMDATGDGSEQESAETQSNSARELLTNMVAGAHKRHTAKKKNVISSHATATKQVETSINELFDEHEIKSLSAHEAQLKRLKQLLNHKAKLEVAMEAKLTTLRASYDAHSRDLENVLNSQIKELK